MLLNTDISIALKNFYGQYDINRFSLFERNKINRNFISLQVKVNNNGIMLKLRCPLCGKYHYYRYSLNEFIKKSLIVGGCEVLGMPLFYVGSYDKVKQRVRRHNQINKKLYAMI